LLQQHQVRFPVVWEKARMTGRVGTRYRAEVGLGLIVSGILFVFVASLHVPLGLTVWVLYLALVIASGKLASSRAPLWCAGVSTLLLGLSTLLQPAGIPLWIAILNRAIGIVILWIVALLLWRFRQMDGGLRQLAAIEGSSADAIVHSDPRWLVTHWNAGAERIFGYSAEEMLGKSISLLVPPERRAEFEQNASSLEAGRFIQDIETERMRKDGTRFRISMTILPIMDVAGRLGGATLIGRDLTAHILLEDQLRTLLQRLEANNHAERAEIARNVHDDLGQILTALRMTVFRLKDGITSSSGSVPQTIAEIGELVDAALLTVRSIAMALHPCALDELDLRTAVEMHAKNVARQSGLDAQVEIEDGGVVLERSCATAVLRILQESLTNVTRHAGASHIRVQLRINDSEVRLVVEDDGRGIRADEIYAAGSLGLLGMRERAAQCGGYLSIGPSSPRGTRLNLVVPIPAPEGQAA
jgi:two-component system sensor histidine kinase UhpB